LLIKFYDIVFVILDQRLYKMWIYGKHINGFSWPT